ELAAADVEAAVSGARAHPDRGWFDELIALPVPDDPPISRWASEILELKAATSAAVASAEPVPRRPPRGPRCDNDEPVRLAEAFLRYAYTIDAEADARGLGARVVAIRRNALSRAR